MLRRAGRAMELQVVSLKVEFGAGVQRWPVSKGGKKGVGSQTSKQLGKPKYNDCGFTGVPTTPLISGIQKEQEKEEGYWRGMEEYNSLIRRRDCRWRQLMSRYKSNCRQNYRLPKHYQGDRMSHRLHFEFHSPRSLHQQCNHIHLEGRCSNQILLLEKFLMLDLQQPDRCCHYFHEKR